MAEHGLTNAPHSSLASALSSFRSAFTGTALMSGVVNVLALTSSFFMLQVYDRVIPSRSIPTLVGLGIVAALLYLFQGTLEVLRSRVLSRIALAMDGRLHERVYSALMLLPLRTKLPGDGLQPMRDLDQVRSFLSGGGPSALFDLPWIPLYLGICFVFHFWIGITALVGAVVLISITLLTEQATREPTKTAAGLGANRNALAEASRRNAEVLRAMGFGRRMSERWRAVNDEFLAANARASDAAGTLGTSSKILRMVLQSFLLAVGAYLVVHREATGGIMIASSIMMGRALAPIELAIANWKGFVAARQGWGRLNHVLGLLPGEVVPTALPSPSQVLVCDTVSIVPPGEKRVVVHDVSFTLNAGMGLGIIGPSASGKSSLVRALVGVWCPARGAVRFDGATLDQWDIDVVGDFIGYLPQDVELFDGTIAENISRFTPEAPPEKVLAAAQAAAVHDMIVHLPEGYQTRIGEGGSGLSAGQRQRVGLARALYGDPFLVVLDEPNSNLDTDGEAALTSAIANVRERGGIVIVVAHRPSALANIGHVLVMANGRQQVFGPKEEVLRKATNQTAAQPPAMKIVASEGAPAS